MTLLIMKMKIILVVVIFVAVFGENAIVETSKQTSELKIFSSKHEFNMHATLLDVMQQKYKLTNRDDKLREMAAKCQEVARDGPTTFNLILMSYLYYPEYKPFFPEENQGTKIDPQPDDRAIVVEQETKIYSQPDEKVDVEKQETKIDTQPDGNVAVEEQNTKIDPQPDETVVVEPQDTKTETQPDEKVIEGKQDVKTEAQPNEEVAVKKQSTETETQLDVAVAVKQQSTETETQLDVKVAVETQGTKIETQPDVLPLCNGVAAPSSEKEVVPHSPKVQTYRDQFLTLAQSTREITSDISSIIKESNNYLKEITSVSKLRLVSCLGILSRVELNAKLYELYLKQIQNSNRLCDILRGGLFSPLSADINTLGMNLILDQIRPMDYKEPLIEMTESNLTTYHLESTRVDNRAKSLCRFKKIGKICLSGAVVAVLVATAYTIAKKSSRILQYE